MLLFNHSVHWCTVIYRYVSHRLAKIWYIHINNLSNNATKLENRVRNKQRTEKEKLIPSIILYLFRKSICKVSVLQQTKPYGAKLHRPAIMFRRNNTAYSAIASPARQRCRRLLLSTSRPMNDISNRQLRPATSSVTLRRRLSSEFDWVGACDANVSTVGTTRDFSLVFLSFVSFYYFCSPTPAQSLPVVASVVVAYRGR